MWVELNKSLIINIGTVNYYILAVLLAFNLKHWSTFTIFLNKYLSCIKCFLFISMQLKTLSNF